METINKELEKLKNRKRVTDKAILELISVVEVLESFISCDIATDVTTTKIKIKYDSFCQNQFRWFFTDKEYTLKIFNGEILLNNCSCKWSQEKGRDIYSHKSIIEFLKSSDTNIFTIEFELMIKALVEVLELASTNAQRIDEDAQKFIDFANNWLKNLEKKEEER